LIERYFDNPEKTLKEAGVVKEEVKRTPNLDKHVVEECLICGEDEYPEATIIPGCNHGFCNTCWKNYLTIKITGKKH
jgi:hypothetical protein